MARGTLPVAAAALLALAGTARADTLLQLIKARTDTTWLAQAVEAANLTGPLGRATAEITVIAPTDAAFTSLPADWRDLAFRAENRAVLRTIVLYHMLPGSYSIEDILFVTAGLGRPIATLAQGARLNITTDATRANVAVNGAPIVARDIKADNGYMHTINTLLLPAGLNLVDVGPSTSPAAPGASLPPLPVLPSTSPRAKTSCAPNDSKCKTVGIPDTNTKSFGSSGAAGPVLHGALALAAVLAVVFAGRE